MSLPDVVESEHMGHPDFRAGGKIFASLGAPNDSYAMVKLLPDDQARFISLAPDAFTAAAGAWGRSGCTLVLLSKATAKFVRPALELAHELALIEPTKKRKKKR